MTGKIAFAAALLELVCTVFGVQPPSQRNTQPLTEIKIEKGIPYGKDNTDSDWDVLYKGWFHHTTTLH